MVKKANWLEMAVNTDLSHASLNDAVDLIYTEIQAQKLAIVANCEWFVITVSNPWLSTAARMLKTSSIKYGVIIDDQYNIDEWSVKYNAVEMCSHNKISITVWSPGA